MNDTIAKIDTSKDAADKSNSWNRLHRLWTDQVGRLGYDKKLWKELEMSIIQDEKELLALRRLVEWIPVGERQPTETGIFLVDISTFNNDGELVGNGLEIWFCEHGSWTDSDGDEREYSKVNAWMPLPKPFTALAAAAEKK